MDVINRSDQLQLEHRDQVSASETNCSLHT